MLGLQTSESDHRSPTTLSPGSLSCAGRVVPDPIGRAYERFLRALKSSGKDAPNHRLRLSGIRVISMRTTSNRELARQIGVSETAVRRAEKSGRIRREADGAWDLARVKAAWAGNTDRAQQRREHAATRPVPAAAIGAVRETLREHGEPVSAGAMTFMQARTANEVMKAQERRVRLQRMKGELIDRAKALAHVFRLARDERDAWVNWPARVAAMMAAELGLEQHQVHTVLERHVRNHLSELADVRPNLR